MRCYHVLLALVLGLGAAPAVLAQGELADSADAARIEKLVKQLGSPKFADRAHARLELKKIGEPALDALRRAVTSEDAEMSRSATALVAGIEAKLLNAKLLAPKRVQLDVDNRPVLDALGELSRQSGYPIEVVGDRTALAGRKVTLHTGSTTFWEAFDQLCHKGGLVEVTPANPYAVPGVNPYGVAPVPRPRPIRIQPLPPQPAPGILPPVPALKPPAGGLNAQVIIQQQLVNNGGAAVPVQVAVQVPVVAQPGAVQAPLPVQGIPRQAVTGPLSVMAGTPTKLPTSYAGAVRVRVSKAVADRSVAGEKFVYLEVMPEPRLQGFVVTGAPALKAVDDQGQTLSATCDGMPVGQPAVWGRGGRVRTRVYNPYLATGGRQTVPLRLKLGEKPAQALKELSGTLTAQVLTPPEPLLKVDNVLKAAGKVSKGANGGSLEVVSISKEDNGDYKVQVRLENPPSANPFGMGRVAVPGGAVQIQINGVQVNGGPVFVRGLGNNAMPSLVDAKGQPYQVAQMPRHSMRSVNGVISQEMTLVFRAQPGQGGPASLVVNGQRAVTVTIPFHLENVPLP